MDFLHLAGKSILITGVSNKKSVAYFVAKCLKEHGAEVIFTVQNKEIQDKVEKLFPGAEIALHNRGSCSGTMLRPNCRNNSPEVGSRRARRRST